LHNIGPDWKFLPWTDTSLLQRFVNYGRKNFMRLSPGRCRWWLRRRRFPLRWGSPPSRRLRDGSAMKKIGAITKRLSTKTPNTVLSKNVYFVILHLADLQIYTLDTFVKW